MVNVLIFKESRYPVSRKAIREAVEEILAQQGIKRKTEVSISIVGDRKMRELNKKYAQKDETTDVLSFSLQEGSGNFVSPSDGILRLGDVVVSYPQVMKNAAENNVLVDEEIKTLVKHGVLHLLGVHHDD